MSTSWMSSSKPAVKSYNKSTSWISTPSKSQPQSSKTNKTPSATTGMTMKSVAEASKKLNDDDKKKSSSSSSKSSKTSSSSNRQAAAAYAEEVASKPTNKYDSSNNVWRDLIGNIIPTANAQTTTPVRGAGIVTTKQNTSGYLGDLFDLLGQKTKDVVHGLGYQVPDFGISESLGINKNIPSGLQPIGEQPYVDWTDRGTVAGSYSDSSQSQPYSVPTTPKTTNDVLNLGKGPINYPGVTDKNINRSTQPVSNPYTNPVSNPFTNPFAGGISQAYDPQAGAETLNTPVTPENATIQRPVGMGQFSRGQYGNGAGNYGIQGGLTGTQDSSLWDNILYNINPENWMKNYQNFRTSRDNYASNLQQPQLQPANNNLFSNQNLNEYIQPPNEGNNQFFTPNAQTGPDYQTESMNAARAIGQELKSKPVEQRNPVATMSNFNNLVDSAKGFLGDTAYADEGTNQNNSNDMLSYNPAMSAKYIDQLARNQSPDNYINAKTATTLPDYAGGMSQPSQIMAQMGGMPSGQVASTKSSDTSGAETKAAKKAWKALQKSIEAQYSQDVASGTQSMNEAKMADLGKLNAMFNFGNSDPNDEQRIQYNQRTQNDYAGRLNELLAKLSAAKNQSYLQGEQGYQNQLATIAQARADAQAKMQQLAQSQAQQQWNNRLQLAKLLGYGQKQTAPSSAKQWVDPNTGDIYEYEG